jgi:hypothetical protein
MLFTSHAYLVLLQRRLTLMLTSGPQGGDVSVLVPWGWSYVHVVVLSGDLWRRGGHGWNGRNRGCKTYYTGTGRWLLQRRWVQLDSIHSCTKHFIIKHSGGWMLVDIIHYAPKSLRRTNVYQVHFLTCTTVPHLFWPSRLRRWWPSHRFFDNVSSLRNILIDV